MEIEQHLDDLQQIQQALQQAEQGRALSEDKFTKVFRSSPIAFFITTVAEGRFIDANEAFERKYGYSREDILGRTLFDIGLWADSSDRSQMLHEIREQGRVRNRVTRLRKRSGEIIETIYSADMIDLD